MYEWMDGWVERWLDKWPAGNQILYCYIKATSINIILIFNVILRLLL